MLIDDVKKVQRKLFILYDSAIYAMDSDTGDEQLIEASQMAANSAM